eukprot:Rhum_TRINITY_DN15201_c8_g1::Rhum_TRINITY_DN15201_c8_g1_i1::g.144164::m.144164
MSRVGTVLQRLVSGGQTGVDRAALDAAMQLGVDTGGWCPKGRRAEDGRIPDRYALSETESGSYAVRTEWNVRDSDGTLILVWERIVPRGGTELTVKFAEKHKKPYYVSDISQPPTAEQTRLLRAWVADSGISVLNVAGPRESDRTPVYQPALATLLALLSATAVES